MLFTPNRLCRRAGKIFRSVAFFDSIAFDDFWERVQPKTPE
jgi:hypothetical protein